MASDQDVGYLKFLPHLCHLEVAFLSFFSLYISIFLFRWNSLTTQAPACYPCSTSTPTEQTLFTYSFRLITDVTEQLYFTLGW